ncbi:hypothetical protein [Paracoccus sp. (in: a-proteobacteria)]|uniref:hypothetical protein n=1 Tax=Paracoccus sp. TaxID=267 RepID=UPI00321FCCD5
MNTITLSVPLQFSHTIPFPSEWDELTTEELLFICAEQLYEGKLIQFQKAAIFDFIFRNRAKDIKELKDNPSTYLDPEDAALAAIDLLDFLYKSNNLTRQHFPLIDISGTNFIGPEDNFDSITCGEFEDTEIFYQDFITDPRPEPMARLTAILWRQKGQDYMYFNAEKHKWLTYNHEPFTAAFSKLPESQLYAIFAWYSGCRSLLQGWFPYLYESGINSDEPDMLVFTKCIHAGAGEKNGSREDIRRMLLKEFFLDMNISAQNNKKLVS